MAGLNDFLTGTSTSATTLPSWYDTAQQNVVNQAQAGAAAMPQLQNTVAGTAINNLSGANNPFTQAQNIMGNIATGAANPWIVTPTQQQPNWSAIQSDPTFLASVDSFGPVSNTGYGSGLTAAEHGPIDMGNGNMLPTNLGGGSSPFAAGISNAGSMQSGGYTIAPNVNTPLGGLFAAQNQQLNQLLPSTIAPTMAASIGTGNFGSLRGQTAVDKAKADALANLQAQQMQAALTSQQTGVNAATGLSNIGKEGTATMMQTGQAQQAAPLTATADLAKILASVNAPASVTQSDQLSGLQQLTGLLNSVQTGVTGANSLLGALFPKSGTGGTPLNLNSLFSGLGSLFTSDNIDQSTNQTPQITPDGGTGTPQNVIDQYQQQAADELAALQNQNQNQNQASETDASGWAPF